MGGPDRLLLSGLDEIEVQVEVTPEAFGDTVRAVETLQQRLARALEHTLGLRARVRLVGPPARQRSAGKAQRVIDNRNH